MGRRDRERKRAIIAGQATSIAQSRRNLMLEVVRRATKILFENADPHALMETMNDDITAVVIDVLPASLEAVGTRRFHLRDITKDKDWMKLVGVIITQVLAEGSGTSGKFRRVKKDLWALRKRPGTSKGRWKYCCWCGGPFYTPRSKCRQKFDSPTCYWAAYRTKSIPVEPDFVDEAKALA